MKKAIITLVIGVVFFIAGYIMKEDAKDQMKFGYTYRPPYANAEEKRVATLYKTSDYVQIAGAIIGIGGILWVVVSAIQSKK